MKIANAKILRRHLKLNIPYKLSFATLSEFNPCFIAIKMENGNLGIGEATALKGYSSETHEQIFKVLEKSTQHLVSSGIHQARSIVDEIFRQNPFAASAIGTALDFAYDSFPIPDSLSCPLVYPLPSDLSADQILQHIETAAQQNFRTIKVKVGQNIDHDIKYIGHILASPHDIAYRFDANQGYSLNEAIQFIKEIEKSAPEKVELVEQPFGPDQWHEMQQLCKLTKIPMMLDESIFHREDILRAKEIGCSYIKLKLFKTRGLNDLIAKSELAHKIGLKVILGNGVSTDIANLAEAFIFSSFPDYFHGAFEGNGFTRIESGLLKNSLRLIRGNAVWEKQLPVLDTLIFDN